MKEWIDGPMFDGRQNECMNLVSEEHLLEKSIGGHDWNLATSIQSKPGLI